MRLSILISLARRSCFCNHAHWLHMKSLIFLNWPASSVHTAVRLALYVMLEPREFAAKVCSEKFNDFVHLLFVPELI